MSIMEAAILSLVFISHWYYAIPEMESAKLLPQAALSMNFATTQKIQAKFDWQVLMHKNCRFLFHVIQENCKVGHFKCYL